MAEMDTSGGGHKKGPGVKKQVKKSTRVDLTPMVDLGFLLITFFVFTTTMSQATAMNMNEPKESKEDQKLVKESGATTILLGRADKVYYYFGTLDPTKLSEQFKSSTFKEIREVITTKKNNTPLDDLMFVIKSDDKSTFKNAIDILDEMTISGVKPGHYAEDKISETEKMLIQKTEEANGVK